MGHFNFEFRSEGGDYCAKCNEKAVLVSLSPSHYGEIDYEDVDRLKLEDSQVHVGELTGRYCLKCEKLLSLCLNDYD